MLELTRKYPDLRKVPSRRTSGNRFHVSALHFDARTHLLEPARSLPLSTGEALRNSTPAQRRLALVVCMALLLCTGLLLPFAAEPLHKIPGFFAIYQTAAIATCLLTGFLMYGHFTAVREVALLHLSAGYFYTAAVLVMQLASVDSMFVEGVRLVGGAQSTIWLWFFWHLVPAVGVLHLALARRRLLLTARQQRQAVIRTVSWLVVALAATSTMILGFHGALPVLDVGGDYRRIISTGLGPGIELLLLAALAVLWKASSFRKVLHVWLGILIVALICDNTITMLAGHRDNFGWYAGRLGALVGFSVLAVVYLLEINGAYLKNLSELATSNSRLDFEFQQSKRQTDELVLADVRKDEFLMMLAHELRNPLAPMSAAAHLLSLGCSNENLVKETSLMLNRQVEQMSGLVEDLLDAARLSRDVAEIRKMPVDVKQVVSQSVEQARPLLTEKAHDLDIRIAQEDVFVTGDHRRLVQVVTNLLVNSAKYTERGGKIILKLEATGSEVVITVADNGIGMTQELLSRAFRLFTQGQPTAAHSQGGLGVGLALVKRLVELHDGQVRATSDGAGLGTELVVSLPRVL